MACAGGRERGAHPPQLRDVPGREQVSQYYRFLNFSVVPALAPRPQQRRPRLGGELFRSGHRGFEARGEVRGARPGTRRPDIIRRRFLLQASFFIEQLAHGGEHGHRVGLPRRRLFGLLPRIPLDGAETLPSRLPWTEERLVAAVDSPGQSRDCVARGGQLSTRAVTRTSRSKSRYHTS